MKTFDNLLTARTLGGKLSWTPYSWSEECSLWIRQNFFARLSVQSCRGEAGQSRDDKSIIRSWLEKGDDADYRFYLLCDKIRCVTDIYYISTYREGDGLGLKSTFRKKWNFFTPLCMSRVRSQNGPSPCFPALGPGSYIGQVQFWRDTSRDGAVHLTLPSKRSTTQKRPPRRRPSAAVIHDPPKLRPDVRITPPNMEPPSNPFADKHVDLSVQPCDGVRLWVRNKLR